MILIHGFVRIVLFIMLFSFYLVGGVSANDNDIVIVENPQDVMISVITQDSRFLTLGDLPSEVREVLGEPEGIRNDPRYPHGVQYMFDYNNIALVFYRDALFRISVSGKEYTLINGLVVGDSKNNVYALFQSESYWIREEFETIVVTLMGTEEIVPPTLGIYFEDNVVSGFLLNATAW